jgi:hypothetical protein
MRNDRFVPQFALRSLTTIAVLAALMPLVACGGGSSSPSPTPTPTPTPTTAVTQIRIGDAPVDRVIVFELTTGQPRGTDSERWRKRSQSHGGRQPARVQSHVGKAGAIVGDELSTG